MGAGDHQREGSFQCDNCTYEKSATESHTDACWEIGDSSPEKTSAAMAILWVTVRAPEIVPEKRSGNQLLGDASLIVVVISFIVLYSQVEFPADTFQIITPPSHDAELPTYPNRTLNQYPFLSIPTYQADLWGLKCLGKLGRFRLLSR